MIRKLNRLSLRCFFQSRANSTAVYLCTLSNQKLHHSPMPFFSGYLQRPINPSEPSTGIDVGTCFEEEAHGMHMISIRSPMQWSHSILAVAVRVVASVQKLPYRFNIASGTRVQKALSFALP